jgi:hypothetical protein
MPRLPDSITVRPLALEAVDVRGRRLGRVVEIRRARSTGRVTGLIRRRRFQRLHELDLTGCVYEPGRVRLPR